MNRVVEILINRDGMTEDEANRELDSVRTMIESCNFDPVESENIIREELGLELDYLIDIVWNTVNLNIGCIGFTKNLL